MMEIITFRMMVNKEDVAVVKVIVGMTIIIVIVIVVDIVAVRLVAVVMAQQYF